MTPESADEQLRRVLKQHADRPDAPDRLRNALRLCVEQAAGDGIPSVDLSDKETPAPRSAVHAEPRPARRARSGWTLDKARVAAFLSGAVAGALVLRVALWPIAAPLSPTLLALLSDHARALVTSQTIEVESASTHTVKPWLGAKLGYSPLVADLAAEGFPLLGGRRGFLGAQGVAVMVYRYREHLIDLYALQAVHGKTINALAAHDGFNMRTWVEGDLHYVAISDVGSARLDQFVRAVQQAQQHAVD